MGKLKSIILRITRGVSRRLTAPGVTYAVLEPFLRAMRFARRSQPDRQSILVVRLDEIGDFVLTTAMLRELRKHHPGSRITLVVKPSTYNLAETCPYADSVLAFDPPDTGLFLEMARWTAAFIFSARHLWPRKIDTAIHPRWDLDPNFATQMLYFSGARRRIGYSESVSSWKKAYNRGGDRLLTDALETPSVDHETLYALRSLAPLGVRDFQTHLEVWPTEDDERRARALLSEAGAREGEPLVAIGPGGGTSRLKQWPESRFAELADRLLSEGSASRIVIIGGGDEQALAKRLSERIGAAKVIAANGRTTLRETAALLGFCRVYIGNDTGPMHIAAAMGTPLVSVFGGSCPHRFHPWSPRARTVVRDIPCRPCREEHFDRCNTCPFESPRCLDEITAGDVHQEIGDLGLRPEPAIPAPSPVADASSDS